MEIRRHMEKELFGNRKNLKLICYALPGFGDGGVLTYSTGDLDDFVKMAGKETVKVLQRMFKPRGASIFIQVGRKQIPLGEFAVSAKGQLYGYIGQGIYERRSMGPRLLAGYIRGAIRRFNVYSARKVKGI